MDLSVMSVRSRLAVLIPTIALVLSVAAPVGAATPAANVIAVTAGLGYLGTQQQADGSMAGFDGVSPWALMAYTSAGQTNTNLKNYLMANPPAAGAPATEWEKGILAIVGSGNNPYSFGGVDYVAGLKTTYTGGQIGSATALNDDAYGILALVSANVATSDVVLRDALAFVLAHQLTDGGFSYSAAATATSDADSTAAALAALQAAKTHGSTAAGLDAAIAEAKAYLLGAQNADGGFYSDPAWGTASNVSTTAVALIALNSLGLGNGAPATNASSYLRSTQQADGSFPYMLPVAEGETGDTFNTSYALAGLGGGTWPQAIFRGNVPTPSATPTPSASPTPAPDGSVLGAGTVSGGSGILPEVGELSNQILLAIAGLIALVAGFVMVILQRRRAAGRS